MKIVATYAKRISHYREMASMIELRSDGVYWKVSSGRAKPGNRIGGSAVGNYLGLTCAGKKFYMHRAVYFLKHGVVPTVIDHIDGNPKNNSPENLQDVTASINNHRRLVMRDKRASVYRGLVWLKVHKKWRARIFYKGHSYVAGLYSSERLAAHAYDLLALDKYGNQAITNFDRKIYGLI